MKLKPCPFCGSPYASINQAFERVWVECATCESQGPVCGTDAAAGKAWNRRTKPRRDTL